MVKTIVWKLQIKDTPMTTSSNSERRKKIPDDLLFSKATSNQDRYSSEC